jgi:hypothetical protein
MPPKPNAVSKLPLSHPLSHHSARDIRIWPHATNDATLSRDI